MFYWCCELGMFWCWDGPAMSQCCGGLGMFCCRDGPVMFYWLMTSRWCSTVRVDRRCSTVCRGGDVLISGNGRRRSTVGLNWKCSTVGTGRRCSNVTTPGQQCSIVGSSRRCSADGLWPVLSGLIGDVLLSGWAGHVLLFRTGDAAGQLRREGEHDRVVSLRADWTQRLNPGSFILWIHG